eukprot:3254792-Pleurochrysis_carterae.AAC.2
MIEHNTRRAELIERETGEGVGRGSKSKPNGYIGYIGHIAYFSKEKQNFQIENDVGWKRIAGARGCSGHGGRRGQARAKLRRERWTCPRSRARHSREDIHEEINPARLVREERAREIGQPKWGNVRWGSENEGSKDWLGPIRGGKQAKKT